MPHNQSYNYQAGFVETLFQPHKVAPHYVQNARHEYAPKRFAVYRNNVVVSLMNALADGFPLCQNIVGEEFFHYLAREYLYTNPPNSPLLFLYGADFAQFIEVFSPARSVPYLADMARLEYEKRLSYFARDEVTIPQEFIAGIPLDRLSSAELAFADSVKTLSSDFPIYDIFMRQSDENFPLSQAGQDILITRQEGIVKIHRAPTGFHQFFQLAKTQNIEAAIAAIASNENFDEIPKILGLILPFITTINGVNNEDFIQNT